VRLQGGSAYIQVTTSFAEQHDPEKTTVLLSALPTKKTGVHGDVMAYF
jgi:hypothetical protein